MSLSSTGNAVVVGGLADATNVGAVWIFVPGASFSQEPLENRLSENPLVTSDFRLEQSVPNPASGVTSVAFRIPYACTAEWRITDNNGRIVSVMKKDYQAGDNVEIFDMSDRNGIFWYTLKTPFGVLTRRMTVIRE